MSELHCPNGCGPLTVFLTRRRNRPYTGCRACMWADWGGANIIADTWAGATADVERFAKPLQVGEVISGMLLLPDAPLPDAVRVVDADGIPEDGR